jgi:DNA-binding beta-propeller fold protein YncE
MGTFSFTSISRKMVYPVSALVVINLFSLLGISRALASSAWMVADRIPLKGDEFWDHATLQPEQHRLFVAHHDRLVVVDLLARAEVGSIPGQGVCKAIIVPDVNRGFVTNSVTGNVTVFDLTTLASQGTIKADPDADAICYEPVTRRIFTFNGESHSSTVVDPEHTAVIGRLRLDGSPESAEPDGHGGVFVIISDKDQVQKIDAAESKVVLRWPLTAQTKPVTIAVDQQHERIFIGCRNQTLLVLDSTSGKELASLKIGKWVDDTVYDAARRRIFVCCGDGTLTVIRQDSPDSYQVEAVVPTELGVHTIAFDSATNTIYAPAAKLKPIAPQDPHPHPQPIPGTFHILVLTEATNR